MGNSASIDLQHLDKYVAGDRALRDEILGIFEEQADLWIRMLDPRGDDGAWKDAAHALKGAARGVGAWTIGDICADAENLIGDNRSLSARLETLSDLKKAVAETVNEVRRLRAL
ncbi:MAG: Hpt domain-containing protein [Pseudomonadota bacterium]